MPNLWICGICQNNKEDIHEIMKMVSMAGTSVGLLFVDGGSTDGTLEVLEDYGACVVHRKWTNDHDFQMNEYLRSGAIKHGDWVLQMDTSERAAPGFIKRLREVMLVNFEKQGINTVYQRSKPILFRYYDDQFYLGSPHWGLHGQRPTVVDISKFDGFQDDKTYFWSNRDDINKWITNGMKYYFVYGRSNHMWLVYNPKNYPGTTEDFIIAHERARQSFRDYCRNELKIPMTLEGIKSYMLQEEFTEKFIEYMKFEKVLRNYYRYIKGEDQKNIYDTQNTWIFSI